MLGPLESGMDQRDETLDAWYDVAIAQDGAILLAEWEEAAKRSVQKE